MAVYLFKDVFGKEPDVGMYALVAKKDDSKQYRLDFSRSRNRRAKDIMQIIEIHNGLTNTYGQLIRLENHEYYNDQMIVDIFKLSDLTEDMLFKWLVQGKLNAESYDKMLSNIIKKVAKRSGA